jgi:Asp-tRNA(Asn)/Glu-tRNA(Gln) amidotransferase A subunit family amidase
MSDSYDVVPLKAPRLTGLALKLLVGLAEMDFLGRPLRTEMKKTAGIQNFRETPCSDSPIVEPLPQLAGADGTGSVDPGAAAGLSRVGRGFQFETVADFHAAYQSGATTPIQVAERISAAIAASEELAVPMRTFIAHDSADLAAQAKASAARWAAGEPLGPLDGVPIAVKDELDQTPYPTTVGTSFLGTSPATSDATVVARLRAAGALLIGKANMHEVGIGVTGLNPHHGAARNPYDPGRVTGGSSSGSAAAVASGLCPISLGADGGGSVRTPASLCGVVGFKATWGRISEHGAAPLCWHVAHVGPLGATIADAAAAYAVMAGPDPQDSWSLKQPAVHLDELDNGDLSGMTLGIYRPWFDDADPGVVAACEGGVAALVAAGAKVQEITIPELSVMRVAHLVTIASEIVASQMQLDRKHRKDYGLDVRMNFALARDFSAADYVHARRHRNRFTAGMLAKMVQVDVVVTPTNGCTAPILKPDALPEGESDLETLDRIMRFVTLANLIGFPALSVPCGADEGGLPVGLQLMGRPWEEALLFRMGRVVERAASRLAPQVHWRLLGGEIPSLRG